MKKRIVLFITGTFLILICSFNPLPPGEWPNPGTQGSTENENRYPISEIDGMQLVYIPAGEFQMGAPKTDFLAEEDEKPAFRLYLDAFWIDRTEVSNQMYAAFLNSLDQDDIVFVSQYGSMGNINVWFDEEKSPFYLKDNLWQVKEGLDNHPAVYVSWYGAEAYCRWAGRRLPNEAEWEKAAGGDSQTLYPWGNDLDCQHANFAGCVNGPMPVNSLQVGASPYGVLNMAGNVWEHVRDVYDENAYQTSEYIPASPVTEREIELLPLWLSHVVRGGSWKDEAGNLRTTNRTINIFRGTFEIVGFRCAVSAEDFFSE